MKGCQRWATDNVEDRERERLNVQVIQTNNNFETCVGKERENIEEWWVKDKMGRDEMTVID